MQSRVSLPLRSRRSPKGSRRRPPRSMPGAGAIPDLHVKVRKPGEWPSFAYIHARIQVRRTKYRYLVWYEDGRKREFYLGQVKTVPLRRDPADVAIAPGASSAGGPAAGAKS